MRQYPPPAPFGSFGTEKGEIRPWVEKGTDPEMQAERGGVWLTHSYGGQQWTSSEQQVPQGEGVDIVETQGSCRWRRAGVSKLQPTANCSPPLVL